MLVPSGQNVVFFAEKVEENFKDVCGTHVRLKGVPILPPESLTKDMMLWREMRVRHLKGDYRHTEDEAKATKAIASWTLDVNCALRNQTRTKMPWE